MPATGRDDDSTFTVLGTVVWDASVLFSRWALYFGMLVDGSHTARCRISIGIGDEVVVALWRKGRWDALEHFAAGAKRGWFHHLLVVVTDAEVEDAAARYPAVDAGDRHVVAAAGIRVLTADAFGRLAIETNGAAIVQLARGDGQDGNRLADRLVAAGMAETADALRSLLAR